MKALILRIISIFLLSTVALTGCASRGSEFLGSWVNAQNPNDTFQVIRNGDEYLIVGMTKRREWEPSTRMGLSRLKELSCQRISRTSSGPTPFWHRDSSVKPNTGGRNKRARIAPGAVPILCGRVRP